MDTPESDRHVSALARKTNWWGAFVIGLAGTILVTGIAPVAVQGIGPASIPLFLCTTAAGVILCLCLAELAALMPDRTGGLPSYAAETYQVFGPTVARHVGGVSAWAYGLGWFPVAPINMILAARYIASLWNLPLGPEFTPIGAPIPLTVLVIAVVGLLLLFIPCYKGIRFGAAFATVFGIISMIPLTLIVFLPLLRPQSMVWSRLNGFRPSAPEAAGFSFYVSWIFVMTWSVLAMEASACYIGECERPSRDAKIAMTASGLYGFFIYAAIPIMLVVVLGTSQADPLTAFIAYTQAIFGSGGWAKWFIGIPLILALLLSVLNAIMGCGRALYQTAHDGLLPRAFQHRNEHGVPDVAMAFNLVASVAVVFFGSPVEIYIFSNMGYLFSLALALIGYFLHRQYQPDAPRPVRLPGFVRFVALGLGIAFLFIWAYGGYYASDIAVSAGKRWLFFLGLAVIFMYMPLFAYRRLVDDRRSVSVGAPVADVDV
jgi:amino acid transporter